MEETSNQFVRMEDLRAILSEYFEQIATKDDLTAFASVDDIQSLRKDLAGLAKELRTITRDIKSLKSDSNKSKIQLRSTAEFQDKIMLHVLSMKHIVEDQLVNRYTFEQFKDELFTQLDALGNFEEKNDLEHKTQDYRMKKMNKLLKTEKLRNDEQDVKIKNNKETIDKLNSKVA
ncbi:hypothetical protein JXJ21_22105 [candidate division KSB1 bacterium]|nr:hypothetical protein [candidate division KSB1 bacterium]